MAGSSSHHIRGYYRAIYLPTIRNLCQDFRLYFNIIYYIYFFNIFICLDYFRNIRDFAVIGLPASGALLTIGGIDHASSNKIWRLMNNDWSLIGILPVVLSEFF